MEEMFREAFESFNKINDSKQKEFILQYYNDTYKNSEKAQSINKEVNDYFDRVNSNSLDLQLYKKQGFSRNKWIEDKLELYDKDNPGSANEITNLVQDYHNKYLKVIGVENNIKPLNTSFTGIGKRIASKIFDKIFTENTYIDIIQTDEIYKKINTKNEPVFAIKRYFEEDIDSPYNEMFKKLGTAVVLRAQEKDKVNILKDKTSTDIAAIIDRTYTLAKCSYLIANNKMQPSEAIDGLIDFSTARVEAIIYNTAKKAGGQFGQKVGAALGTYFGPNGTAIGATIGKFIGERAGEFIANKISDGLNKIALYAKEKVGSFINKVGSYVSTSLNRIKFKLT